MSKPQAELISARLKAPRAAAIAGILFSVLLVASFLLLRHSVPPDPLEAGAWLRSESGAVVAGLNLMPFAGIAFLWFMGVLRDRLGDREDRFFATVFLGSGLLFLAMLFLSAAVAGGIIIAYTAHSDRLLGSAAFHLARAISYEALNIYAIRMAGVFMIATSTLALQTRFIARWIAFRRLYPGGNSSVQHPLHRRNPSGLPSMGAPGQSVHFGGQLSQSIAIRDHKPGVKMGCVLAAWAFFWSERRL